jgi:hypothetical protein
MAAISNPNAIDFVNEVIRPLCEEARSLQVRLNALRTQWYAGQNTVFAQAADTVEDGREVEGVSRLTAGDVTNAVSQLIKTATGEAGAWNSEIVQKPCVRLLP